MKTLSLVGTLLIGAIAAGGGFAAYHYLVKGGAVTNVTAFTESITVEQIKNGKKPVRPRFILSDLNGKKRNINEWDGKIIILNFWASWCPPCIREMPAFVKLQEKYGKQGVQVIGIAIDQKQLVEDFIDRFGVTFPTLIGELDAVDVARRYGNHRGQLPYTVFINRKKQVVGVKRGEVKAELAEKVIRNLLGLSGTAGK